MHENVGPRIPSGRGRSFTPPTNRSMSSTWLQACKMKMIRKTIEQKSNILIYARKSLRDAWPQHLAQLSPVSYLRQTARLTDGIVGRYAMVAATLDVQRHQIQAKLSPRTWEQTIFHLGCFQNCIRPNFFHQPNTTYIVDKVCIEGLGLLCHHTVGGLVEGTIVEK